MRRVAIAFGLFVAAPPALAASLCIPASGPRGAIVERNGQWIALTREQRMFLAGVYVINPKTPSGLPLGDSAVLAQMPGDKSGLVFFIDGDKACTPMPIPAELVDMLQRLEEVSHEGTDE